MELEGMVEELAVQLNRIHRETDEGARDVGFNYLNSLARNSYFFEVFVLLFKWNGDGRRGLSRRDQAGRQHIVQPLLRAQGEAGRADPSAEGTLSRAAPGAAGEPCHR